MSFFFAVVVVVGTAFAVGNLRCKYCWVNSFTLYMGQQDHRVISQIIMNKEDFRNQQVKL